MKNCLSFDSSSMKPIEHSGECFSNNFEEITRSGDQKGKRPCICCAFTPLLRTFQFMGIFPVKYDKRTCNLSHSWISVSAFISWFWFFENIALFTGVYTFAANFLSIFTGTDFYTISIVFIAHFVTTTFVFFVANFRADSFCRAFDLLHASIRELCINDFTYVKRLTYFIPTYIFTDAAVSMIPIYCEQDPAMKSPPILSFFLTYAGNFVPNLVTASFATILWIVSVYFERVNAEISAILQITTTRNFHLISKDSEAESKISQLCNLHEDICNCVRYFTDAFGPQLLLIFGCTLFRFISGIYGVATSLTGLEPSRLTVFTVNNFLTSSLAWVRIMVVLRSSQQVIENSNELANSLLRAQGSTTSDKMRNEITAFLDKLENFPLEIICCGVQKLDTTYIACAIPSIITYVLVLMQFKQADQEDGSFEAPI